MRDLLSDNKWRDPSQLGKATSQVCSSSEWAQPIVEAVVNILFRDLSSVLCSCKTTLPL
jgi:hypothetical protein